MGIEDKIDEIGVSLHLDLATKDSGDEILGRIEDKIDQIALNFGIVFESNAGTSENTGDDDLVDELVDGVFDVANDAVDSGVAGDAAGIATNTVAPGAGVVVEHLIDEHGNEVLDTAEDAVN